MNQQEKERYKRILDAVSNELAAVEHPVTPQSLARFLAMLARSVSNKFVGNMSELELETLTKDLEPIVQEWLDGKL